MAREVDRNILRGGGSKRPQHKMNCQTKRRSSNYKKARLKSSGQSFERTICAVVLIMRDSKSSALLVHIVHFQSLVQCVVLSITICSYDLLHTQKERKNRDNRFSGCIHGNEIYHPFSWHIQTSLPIYILYTYLFLNNQSLYN